MIGSFSVTSKDPSDTEKDAKNKWKTIDLKI
jgi:hypothetical protein